MTKLNLKHIILILIMFLVSTKIVFAGVIFNEIQLTPTENRFIELYNSSSSDIDLTDWYIQRKTSTGSSFGSLISKTLFSEKIISKGGFFLISKTDINNSDIIYDGLTLTESNSIIIKNNEGNIVDKISWGDSSECDHNCPNNPTEGKSIQKQSDESWIVSLPSPRLSNNIENTINPTEILTTVIRESTDSSANSNITNSIILNKKIITKIISPNVVTRGIPFSINHQTIGYKGEKIILGKFQWSFGDGMKKEVSVSDEFEYLYEYPGEYVLTLSYFDSLLDIKPIALDRINIKVLESGLMISSIGTYNDPYVEIENNSKMEASLYKLILKGKNNYYIFPENLYILANKKIKLSPRITNFKFDDLERLELTDYTGQVFSTYPRGETKKIIKNTKNISNIKLLNNIEIIDNKTKDTINLNNISASAINSRNLTSISNKTLSIIGLIFIILIAFIGIVLIKYKNKLDLENKDNIDANDFKVIE